VSNLWTVGVLEQSGDAIRLVAEWAATSLINHAIRRAVSLYPRGWGVAGMAPHQFIRAPNQSVIATALQLYNEIISQNNDRYESYSIFQQFLEKLKIIRNDRKKSFPGVKFSDPYWDIIINSAIDFDRGKETSIKAACLSSGVSTTTALRCLRELERIGILQRSADPSDRRRFFIRLTDQSRHSLDAWIRNSLRTVGLIDTSEMGLNCMDIGSSSHDF